MEETIEQSTAFYQKIFGRRLTEEESVVLWRLHRELRPRMDMVAEQTGPRFVAWLATQMMQGECADLFDGFVVGVEAGVTRMRDLAIEIVTDMGGDELAGEYLERLRKREEHA